MTAGSQQDPFLWILWTLTLVVFMLLLFALIKSHGHETGFCEGRCYPELADIDRAGCWCTDELGVRVLADQLRAVQSDSR